MTCWSLVAVGIVALLYIFNYRIFFPKNKEEKRYEQKSEIKEKENTEPEIEEQDKDHINNVYDLIDKDQYAENTKKEASKKAYLVWMKEFRAMYQKASVGVQIDFELAKKNDNYRNYVNDYIVSKLPREDLAGTHEVVAGFTDIFISEYDMDDWALETRLAEIFILKDFSKKNRKGSVVYIENHYVNHDKRGALIEFKLYLPKQI